MSREEVQLEHLRRAPAKYREGTEPRTVSHATMTNLRSPMAQHNCNQSPTTLRHLARASGRNSDRQSLALTIDRHLMDTPSIPASLEVPGPSSIHDTKLFVVRTSEELQREGVCRPGIMYDLQASDHSVRIVRARRKHLVAHFGRHITDGCDVRTGWETFL